MQEELFYDRKKKKEKKKKVRQATVVGDEEEELKEQLNTIPRPAFVDLLPIKVMCYIGYNSHIILFVKNSYIMILYSFFILTLCKLWYF